MGEEEKKELRESEGNESRDRTAPGIETEQQMSDAVPEAETKEASRNHIAEKRGRMIASGVVVAVVVAVIAVAVAAIFQLTSTWLMKCPQDLSVNDPAPILWSDVTSAKSKEAPLGVPKKLAKETSLKVLSNPTE